MSVGHQTFERNAEEEIARANAELDALHTELEARGKRIEELEKQVAEMGELLEKCAKRFGPIFDLPGEQGLNEQMKRGER